MLPLNICNFFKFFIYHPTSEYLSKKDQKIALLARKVLSTLSFTLIPRICQKYWSKRHVWTNQEKTLLSQRISALIQASTVTSPLTHNEKVCKLEEAKKIPCHHILHGLFLGNVKAFMEASHLTLPLDKNSSDMMQNTNHQQFNTVLTYCPLQIICKTYPTLDANAIAPSFIRHRVRWLNLGEAIIDDKRTWYGFVHDSTFPLSDLAKIDINFKHLDYEKAKRIYGPETKRLDAMLNAKKKVINQTKTSLWFAPVFAEIDKAVFHNKRVLVHCQKGYSRSSTIIAAYLINRFNVSCKSALTFLKSKRFCVHSKFSKALKEYEKELAIERYLLQ